MPTVDEIWLALKDVKDPEIPTVSLVDLGVITGVSISPENVAHVVMTPTFVGCPAMEYMRREVEQRLAVMGFAGVDVRMNFDVPWNTNRVTDEGRRGLAEFGLGVPDPYEGILNLDVLNNMACPLCGGRNTTLHSPFGPTLCRSIHYCNTCAQPFEAFKPV